MLTNVPGFPLGRQKKRSSIWRSKRPASTTFSWVYEIRDKHTGEDLYPELRERWLSRLSRRDFEPLRPRDITQI